MKNFLLWLIFSTCALAQTLPWTGNSTNAWLKQAPNGVRIGQSGTNTRVVLNNQSSSGKLIFDSAIGTPSTNDLVMTRASDGSVHISTYSVADLLGSGGSGNQTTIDVTADDQVIDPTGWDIIRLHSDDLTPANRTIVLSAPTEIGQKVMLIAVGADGLVQLPNVSAVDGGSGFVYLGAYDWDSSHVNEALTLQSDGTNWVAQSRQVFPPVIFGSGGQTNWGLLALDPGFGVARNTGVTIADIINGGGPGGTNQNFANTDLTFTGPRTHDADGNSLFIQNLSGLLIAGDSSSSSTGDDSIAIGTNVDVSGDGAIGIGGYDDQLTVSGYGAIAIGMGAISSGDYSTSIGAYGNVASGRFSIAMGIYAKAPNIGEMAISTTSVSGQDSSIRLAQNTLNDTPTILSLLGTATNSPVMPVGSVWLVEESIVGITESAAKVATYVRRYTISRPTNEASTVILGTIETVGTDTGTNAGVPPASWSITIDASTTEGGPRTTVVGDAVDTVRWHASLKINQVSFAP